MSLNPPASQQKWSQRDDGMCPWSLASGNTENQTLTRALSTLPCSLPGCHLRSAFSWVFIGWLLLMMMVGGQKGWESYEFYLIRENEALFTKSQDATLRRKPLDSEDQWKGCPSWQVEIFKKEISERILWDSVALQTSSQRFQVIDELPKW